MKKVIFAALFMACIGTLSSFKNDTTSVNLNARGDKKELGTADAVRGDKKELGTADAVRGDKKELGTADARQHNAASDKKELGTAD